MNEKIGSVSKSVLKESLWKFISTFIGQIGALIFIIIVARILKPEGFGLYNLALSIGLILITLADEGFNRALNRYVAVSLGKNEKEKAASYLRYILKYKVLVLIGLSLFLIIISYPLSHILLKKPALFLPLIIVGFFILAVSTESFFAQLFYVIKKVKLLAVKQLIFQTLRITLILLLFAYLIDIDYLVYILLVIVISNFVAVFVLLTMLRINMNFIYKKPKTKLDKTEKKKVLRFIGYLTVVGISAPILVYVDVLMLGYFLSSEFVGYYSAAFGIIMGATGFVLISTVLLPVFTQMNFAQLRPSFDRVFKYTSMLTIPMIFGALALGDFFIVLFYGNDYDPAKISFYFLSILIFTSILTSTLVSLFTAREKPESFVKPLVFTTILNIFLNLILIYLFLQISPLWATAGAAIATASSRIIYMFMISIIAHKNFNIRFKSTYFTKPLIASIIMFILIFSINTRFLPIPALVGITEVFIGAGIYLTVMLFIKGITKSDIELVKSILPRKLRSNV